MVGFFKKRKNAYPVSFIFTALPHPPNEEDSKGKHYFFHKKKKKNRPTTPI